MLPLLSHVRSGGKGVAIVYCRTIAMLDKIVGYLRKNVDESKKPSIRPFHSDLSENYRNKTLKVLKASDIKIVVATEALGMVG